MIKFEKVSFEQFAKDFRRFFSMLDPETEEKIEIPDEKVLEFYENIQLPKRATKGSAGYDFYLPMPIALGPGMDAVIPTGIKCKMNPNMVLQLYPRSGLGFMYKMKLDNTVGIIYSDYYANEKNEGHIVAKITNDWLNEVDMKLNAGTAFMQGIFTLYFLTDDDAATDRRIGGLGSTDKKEEIQ